MDWGWEEEDEEGRMEWRVGYEEYAMVGQGRGREWRLMGWLWLI